MSSVDQNQNRTFVQIVSQGTSNGAMLSVLLDSIALLLSKTNTTSYESERQQLYDAVARKTEALEADAIKFIGNQQ